MYPWVFKPGLKIFLIPVLTQTRANVIFSWSRKFIFPSSTCTLLCSLHLSSLQPNKGHGVKIKLLSPIPLPTLFQTPNILPFSCQTSRLGLGPRVGCTPRAGGRDMGASRWEEANRSTQQACSVPKRGTVPVFYCHRFAPVHYHYFYTFYKLTFVIFWY